MNVFLKLTIYIYNLQWWKNSPLPSKSNKKFCKDNNKSFISQKRDIINGIKFRYSLQKKYRKITEIT